MPVRVTVPLTSTTSVAAGAGDVDGDGYADVLLGGTTGGGQLLRGGATGLDAARAVAVANTSVPAGDLNGDGRADLAFLTRAGVRVVLGAATLDAAGTAAPGALSPSASMPPRGGDFNGDGFDDVLAGTRGDTLNRSAIVLPGSASGPGAAVTLAAGFGSATVHGAVGAGDVDGDGYDDLLSYQARTTDLYLTRGSASGLSFGRLSYVDLGVEPGYPNVSRAAVGDVDRDGHADYASGPSIYRGSSSGIVRATPWTLPGAAGRDAARPDAARRDAGRPAVSHAHAGGPDAGLVGRSRGAHRAAVVVTAHRAAGGAVAHGPAAGLRVGAGRAVPDGDGARGEQAVGDDPHPARRRRGGLGARLAPALDVLSPTAGAQTSPPLPRAPLHEWRGAAIT